MSQGQRRLAAIMFTDMVGFTALAQMDETAAMKLLDEQRGLLRPIFVGHSGREIKTIGDAFLVEFSSVLDAVKCAIEIQSTLKAENLARPREHAIRVRIGIHLGDVIHEGTDLGGDAVNVASRIEPLAPPGGICVSAQVHASVVNKIEQRFLSLGIPDLKNVEVPIEVFQIEGFGERRIGPLQRRVPSKVRIAVLPFANMSPDPDDEYFADGMTEELIDRLAQVKGIEVIARTSVMSYKKREKKVSEIARELLVGSVVEGSVRKAGKRIRVVAQLINATSEGQVWSSHYDRNLDDIFAVQSEIAEEVAGELRVRLVEGEKETLEKKPTVNTEAYSYYLRGRELYGEETEPSLRQAVRLFESAIELDSSFARALVGLADCHLWLVNNAYEPSVVYLPMAKASLKRAIDLDPDLPEAHASLSHVLFNEDDFPGMEAEARRAIELNPSLPDPYWMLSDLAALRGQPDEMVRLIETAYRLDPIRPRFIGLVGWAYFWTGREQEALEFWRKTERLAPSMTYAAMTEYHLSKGDIERAREIHAKWEKLQPTSPWVTCLGGVIAAQAGDREEALLAIKRIEDSKMGPHGLNFAGFVYHSLGDLDSYFEYMDRALDSHALQATFVTCSPLLTRARADPRYQQLIEKLRRKTGLAK